MLHRQFCFVFVESEIINIQNFRSEKHRNQTRLFYTDEKSPSVFQRRLAPRGGGSEVNPGLNLPRTPGRGRRHRLHSVLVAMDTGSTGELINVMFCVFSGRILSIFCPLLAYLVTDWVSCLVCCRGNAWRAHTSVVFGCFCVALAQVLPADSRVSWPSVTFNAAVLTMCLTVTVCIYRCVCLCESFTL